MSKRQQSCRKIGAQKRQEGHDKEIDFNKRFSNSSSQKTGGNRPEADTNITKNSPLYPYLKKKQIIKDEKKIYYNSNKSGKSIQFILGQIPELNNNNEDALEYLREPENVKSLLNRILKKNDSKFPCDLLVYNDNNNSLIIFNMDEVIDFCSKNCYFRITPSGRSIKGNFNIDGISRQFLTYEYRPTHKEHFFGANCGKGEAFIKKVLMINLNHYIHSL